MQVEQAVKGMKTYEANFVFQNFKAGVKSISQGQILYKDPDKMRIEINLSGIVGQEELILHNGKIKWSYSPSRKFAFKEVASLNTNSFEPFGLNLDPHHLVYQGRAIYDGSECNIFQLEQKDSGTLIKAAVSLKDGIPRQIEFYNKDGTPRTIEEISSVKINVPIGDSKFHFTPPPGTQIIDLSESSKR